MARRGYTAAVMWALADAFFVLAALLYLPVLIYQMIGQGKNRRGWRQRFGGVPRRDGRMDRELSRANVPAL